MRAKPTSDRPKPLDPLERVYYPGKGPEIEGIWHGLDAVFNEDSKAWSGSKSEATWIQIRDQPQGILWQVALWGLVHDEPYKSGRRVASDGMQAADCTDNGDGCEVHVEVQRGSYDNK